MSPCGFSTSWISWKCYRWLREHAKECGRFLAQKVNIMCSASSWFRPTSLRDVWPRILVPSKINVQKVHESTKPLNNWEIRGEVPGLGGMHLKFRSDCYGGKTQESQGEISQHQRRWLWFVMRWIDLTYFPARDRSFRWKINGRAGH